MPAMFAQVAAVRPGSSESTSDDVARPPSTSARARFEPMKPSPPVMMTALVAERVPRGARRGRELPVMTGDEQSSRGRDEGSYRPPGRQARSQSGAPETTRDRARFATVRETRRAARGPGRRAARRDRLALAASRRGARSLGRPANASRIADAVERSAPLTSRRECARASGGACERVADERRWRAHDAADARASVHAARRHEPGRSSARGGRRRYRRSAASTRGTT